MGINALNKSVSKSQFFNYMAIAVLEVLGSDLPTQADINLTEKLIKLIYRYHLRDGF